MHLDDIIKIQVTPNTGFEMESDQVIPNGDWTPTIDGKYERRALVKDFIGTNIRMKRSDVTKYTVMVLANNINWGITEGSGNYDSGQEISIKAIPNFGYQFTQWHDGKQENPRMIQVNGNMNFIANFEPEQVKYTVFVSIKQGQNNMGSVSGGGTGLEPGISIEINATSNPGYKFVRWNDGNTSSNRTIQVTGNKTYTAEFTAEIYTIDVKVKNESMGKAYGTGKYSFGDYVTIKAIPNSGFIFTNWNDGNTDNPRTIKVNKSETFSASFEKDKPKDNDNPEKPIETGENQDGIEGDTEESDPKISNPDNE